MKVAAIGIAGNVGRRIVHEALARCHEVSALGSCGSRPAWVGHDVVVSAVKFVRYEPDMLLEAMDESRVPRLAIVGGAGSLRSPAGTHVADGPSFPEAAKPEAAAGKRFLDRPLQEGDLDWTFLSPAAVFAPGEQTGNFRLGTDDLLVSSDRTSRISFEDFAIALLDEIENPKHSRRHFTVGD